MNSEFLCAHNIHKTYRLGKAKVRVLRGASLTAREGEFLVIRGASGSGKSTLLSILGALDAPDRGTVTFRGWDVFTASTDAQNDYRNRDVGFVFQFYHLFPELNVLENVLMPRLVGHSLGQWWRRRRQARLDALELLDRVGLSHRAAHRPRELSGGERRAAAGCPCPRVGEPAGPIACRRANR